MPNRRLDENYRPGYHLPGYTNTPSRRPFWRRLADLLRLP